MSAFLQKFSDVVMQLQELLVDAEAMSEPPHIKGYRWQSEFHAMCVKRRLPVRTKTKSHHVDRIVNGKRVQCKALTKNCDGAVYLAPGSRAYYMPDDFDILALMCDSTLYLIPMLALQKVNGHVSICLRPASHSKWIDAWHVFGDFDFAEDQMSLFLD